MYKKHPAVIAAVAAALTLLSSTAGLADTREHRLELIPISAPIEADLIRLPAPIERSADGLVNLTGLLEYETELETPHFVVNGWALQFDNPELLAQLVGRQVVIKGTEFDGVSILMRSQIVVTELQVVLEGELTHVTDLEAPHYELDGFVIEADLAQLQAQAGNRVSVTGTMVDGPSIFMKPMLRVKSVDAAGPAVSVREARGVLQYETELETPHYVVDGWALMIEDAALMERLVGKQITVKGREFDGFSILMRPQIEVEEISFELEGNLTLVTDLGTPHLELDGWVVLGETDLTNLAGSSVKLKGSVHMGPSIYMKPVFNLAPASVEATAPAAETRMPGKVLVNGQAPAFAQGPILQDGHLLLPLRAIVEAAGGQVTWNGDLQAVEAELNGQSVTITIGDRTAGKRLLPAAPALVSSHTLVPVEYFMMLGLDAQWDGTTLTLTPARSR